MTKLKELLQTCEGAFLDRCEITIYHKNCFIELNKPMSYWRNKTGTIYPYGKGMTYKIESAGKKLYFVLDIENYFSEDDIKQHKKELSEYEQDKDNYDKEIRI